jgi:hypothetical protein
VRRSTSGRRPKNLVARERKFVAAARARPIHGRDELESRVAARIFQSVARFIGELVKFTFHAWLERPSMKMLAPEQKTRSWRW